MLLNSIYSWDIILLISDYMDLSAVIVAKNEEKQIKYCIESLLKAFEKYDSKQVILWIISNDKTIEIAMDYPIEIYQLKDVLM